MHAWQRSGGEDACRERRAFGSIGVQPMGCYSDSICAGLGGAPGSPRPGCWTPVHSPWDRHTARTGCRGQSRPALRWSCRPSLQDRRSRYKSQLARANMATLTGSVSQVSQQRRTSQHGLTGHLRKTLHQPGPSEHQHLHTPKELQRLCTLTGLAGMLPMK